MQPKKEDLPATESAKEVNNKDSKVELKKSYEDLKTLEI